MQMVMRIFGKFLFAGSVLLPLLLTVKTAKAIDAEIQCQGVGQVPIPCNMGPTATTDSSTTITAGGTFQNLLAASVTRNSLEISNTCGVAGNCVSLSDNCYIYVGQLTAAKKTSILIPPGGYYLRSSGSVPSDIIQGTCDGTGDTIMIKVQ